MTAETRTSPKLSAAAPEQRVSCLNSSIFRAVAIPSPRFKSRISQTLRSGAQNEGSPDPLDPDLGPLGSPLGNNSDTTPACKTLWGPSGPIFRESSPNEYDNCNDCRPYPRFLESESTCQTVQANNRKSSDFLIPMSDEAAKMAREQQMALAHMLFLRRQKLLQQMAATSAVRA